MQKFSIDPILQELDQCNLGFAKDMNPLKGTLLSYMDGAAQAIYNIMNDPKARDWGIAHCNDATDDVWEEGHNAIIRLYVRSRND